MYRFRTKLSTSSRVLYYEPSKMSRVFTTFGFGGMELEKMNRVYLQLYVVLSTCMSMLLISSPAFAYLGPGAGLGLMGSLIAIIFVGLVIVLGLVVYPIRMLRKRRSRSVVDDNKSNTAD
jgi:hypothetical protein